VVAAPVHPAAELHRLAGGIRTQVAAPVAAHQIKRGELASFPWRVSTGPIVARVGGRHATGAAVAAGGGGLPGRQGMCGPV